MNNDILINWEKLNYGQLVELKSIAEYWRDNNISGHCMGSGYNDCRECPAGIVTTELGGMLCWFVSVTRGINSDDVVELVEYELGKRS